MKGIGIGLVVAEEAWPAPLRPVGGPNWPCRFVAVFTFPH
jgi:hypothetical protein